MDGDAYDELAGQQLVWVRERLASVVATYHQACRKGEPRSGESFLIAGVRLVGLLWLEETLGHAPCWTYRGELAFAWHQFRKARRKLVKAGVLTALHASAVTP